MTFELLKRPPLPAAHAVGKIYEMLPPGPAPPASSPMQGKCPRNVLKIVLDGYLI